MDETVDNWDSFRIFDAYCIKNVLFFYNIKTYKTEYDDKCIFSFWLKYYTLRGQYLCDLSSLWPVFSSINASSLGRLSKIKFPLYEINTSVQEGRI